MVSLEERYLALRADILEKEFSKMNPMQKQAVFQTEGPVLILAGAGSGKTTVVVNRIANMIRFGNAYHSEYVPKNISEEDLQFLQEYLDEKNQDIEKVQELLADRPVKPWNILAITFTNKAAGELKERLEKMLGADASDIQASTFHSACSRILRREIEALGYDRNFTIYDSDDSMRIIKEALKALEVNEKNLSPRAVLSEISSAKDKFIDPKTMLEDAAGDFRMETIAKAYAHYKKRLKENNALDFDDIIILTVKLFQENPDVLEKYQERFRYIMVDEYQDTNNSQFLLVNLLSRKHKNICVVGDDDQSIYKFRGATIENILSFENQYDNAKVIRLEQNYRCTQNILDAANDVIANNTQRKGKTLWTKNSVGEPLIIYRAGNELGEAKFIAETILDNVRAGAKFSDHAILYRMNAQSNTIENTFVRAGIPYSILSGMRFYDRKEIKDVLSYLSLVNNHSDSIRLQRIINEPKRGIGDSTIEKAKEIAGETGRSVFDVLDHADEYSALARKSEKIKEFTSMINELGDFADEHSLAELFDELMERTSYLRYLKTLGEEGLTRMENVFEFKTNLIKYSEENPEASLGGFLEEVTLYTDIDGYDEDADKVVMMTMHAAKGLEFPYVFFCGAEDGIFPNLQAIYNAEQLEEERRLAYVCITRAKEKLYITNAGQRTIFGQTVRNRPSRFVREIPEKLCSVTDTTIKEKREIDPSQTGPALARARNRANNDIGVGNVSVPKTAPKPITRVAQPAVKCDLQVGDTVKHDVFGEGVVEKITAMGGDSLIEITFKIVGKKKLMYKFAKLTKI